MNTIASIDDDVYIGDMLEKVLTKENYRVLRAYSGTEALLLLQQEQADLILLDLMLPGLSGEEILPKLAGIPVIVISAKVDVADKVDMLLAGAVDYLTKPFDTKELLARIAVQLRQKNSTGSKDVLVYEEIRMEELTHQVWVAEKEVYLTRTEYAILRLLMNNPRQVVTKSLMLEHISEDTPDCVESSLKVHVSNLRKKLREVTDKDYIEAVWGIGFKMRES